MIYLAGRLPFGYVGTYFYAFWDGKDYNAAIKKEKWLLPKEER